MLKTIKIMRLDLKNKKMKINKKKKLKVKIKLFFRNFLVQKKKMLIIIYKGDVYGKRVLNFEIVKHCYKFMYVFLLPL